MLLPTDVPKEDAASFVQAALDALAAHTAVLDEDGNIIGVNTAWRTFAEANGYPHEQYGIGINYLQVCDAAADKSDEARKVGAAIRDILAGSKTEYKLEYPCHSPQEKRWFYVRISRFVWYDSIRVIVLHHNITELRSAQIEQEATNTRLQAILDNITNAILTVTIAGVIESANAAASHIFGYPIQELQGMSLKHIINEDFPITHIYKHFKHKHGKETTGRRKNGFIFPINFSIQRLKFNNSAVYTCIIQDITNRKRVEQEILEREKVQIALEQERELRELKNRFLSMMGHELNTPLAAISLSHDMLKKYRHVATEEENEQALDNIRQQVEHLRDMVKDVITLSRSESEGLDMELEEVDLITYCRDVVEEFTFTYHRTHQVEFRCDTHIIRARIDRRMLRRVFTNLLSNAIKYSPQGGRVLFRMKADSAKNTVRIQVVDSGIGIPEEDMPRLFEAFHRAHNVGKLPGTGLGLAVVKHIVELHRGNINVKSVPDKGTTFTITLPLHQKPPREDETQEVALKRHEAKNARKL